MPRFNDAAFSTALRSHAAKVAEVAPEAIADTLIETLLDFFSTLLAGCNKPAAKSQDVAKQIKESNGLQRRKVQRMMFKHFAKAGRPRSEAELAWNATVSAGEETPEDLLTKAIADARSDDAAVPSPFDML